ncbi:MAG: hypothetical protein ACLP0J_24550 [Solirubrobacteraceae bacterium]
MRTSPRIGKKAWFGPHRVGWGLGPASIEGVATAIGFSVATSALRKRNDGKRSQEELLLFALFLLVVLLKGTSPGGGTAYKQFKAAQAAAVLLITGGPLLPPSAERLRRANQDVADSGTDGQPRQAVCASQLSNARRTMRAGDA